MPNIHLAKISAHAVLCGDYSFFHKAQCKTDFGFFRLRNDLESSTVHATSSSLYSLLCVLPDKQSTLV